MTKAIFIVCIGLINISIINAKYNNDIDDLYQFNRYKNKKITYKKKLKRSFMKKRFIKNRNIKKNSYSIKKLYSMMNTYENNLNNNLNKLHSTIRYLFETIQKDINDLKKHSKPLQTTTYTVDDVMRRLGDPAFTVDGDGVIVDNSNTISGLIGNPGVSSILKEIQNVNTNVIAIPAGPEGPEGPRGSIGLTGPTGLTGQKGA